jgi:glycosyltransferase involved in cell wall biosynthesis
MMNICRISKGFLPKVDGWSAHAYYLSKYQVQQGHRVVALQPHMADAIEGNLMIKKIRFGFSPNNIGRKGVTLLFCMSSAKVLLFLHQTLKFNIIHVHGDIIEAIVFGGILRQILNRPLTLTIHGSLSRKSLYRKIAPLAFHRMDSIITVSDGIRHDLLALGIPEKKISVISSGVEYARFSSPCSAARSQVRRQLAIPEDTFIVVFVGRLHPVKGITLLTHTAHLLQLHPTIHFLIVGDGPQRDELLWEIADLQNVSFLGLLDHDAVTRVLQASDLFVLPSVDLRGQAEGTPTALLEAMAAGLPAIVSDSGGGKDLICSGQNGHVVPQGDPAAIACAILDLAHDAPKCQQMGAANKTLAMARDWSIIAKQVQQTYQRVLGA